MLQVERHLDLKRGQVTLVDAALAEAQLAAGRGGLVGHRGADGADQGVERFDRGGQVVHNAAVNDVAELAADEQVGQIRGQALGDNGGGLVAG